MPKTDSDILHPECFVSPFGKYPLFLLEKHVLQTPIEYDETTLPDIMVAVQSYNHTADQIGQLHDDIRAQHYPQTKVHTVLLSTNNAPEVEKVACDRGIDVVAVPEGCSLRADYLNVAAKLARANGIQTIYTTVGHALLSNKRVLHAVMDYTRHGDLVAYGVALPKGGTLSERAGAVMMGATIQLTEVSYVQKDQKGLLASDCSALAVDLIHTLGGYNKRYGLGGADGDMARRMLDRDIDVVRVPTLSAHVTKGFGWRDAWRQYRVWGMLDQPHDFDQAVFAGWHPHGGL